MILTPQQMSAVEERVFAGGGVTAEELMEKVGRRMAQAIGQVFPEPGCCLVYCGKGNNGGDALVAARHLKKAGWTVRVRPAFEADDLGELPRRKLREMGNEEDFLHRPPVGEFCDHPVIILDGLLGIGAGGPLRAPLDEICPELNRVRRDLHATVFALDLPTGLDGETGKPVEGCVIADYTLTVTCAKPGLVADAALNHVGRLMVIPVEELAGADGLEAEDIDPSELLTTPQLLARMTPRPFDSHKGIFGRIAIIAGSRGFTGAAAMVSAGALRAGGGLVTLFALDDVYPILASTCLPEVMVRPVDNWEAVLKDDGQEFDVLALGPGIGGDITDDRWNAVCKLIVEFPKPMIIDADGLNILSQNRDLLSRARAARVLTPHPGEMKRLFPEADREFDEPATRATIARTFVERFPATLVLKTARTIVAGHGLPLRYNTTGTPGMATGGMGDVLTGVIAALIGAGFSPREAASIGVWVCGRAGERAILHDHRSVESLLATDLLTQIGPAFEDLRRRAY